MSELTLFAGIFQPRPRLSPSKFAVVPFCILLRLLLNSAAVLITFDDVRILAPPLIECLVVPSRNDR